MQVDSGDIVLLMLIVGNVATAKGGCHDISKQCGPSMIHLRFSSTFGTGNRRLSLQSMTAWGG